MEHTIRFQINDWYDAVEVIHKKIAQGYLLDNIQTTRSNIYEDGKQTNIIIECFEITMIKYEKENENA